MTQKSFFVISLDFELYWGMFDKVTLEQYGENLKGVHVAIPEMLSIFTLNHIHVTWATVGMLMAEDKNTLLQSLPPHTLQPKYENMNISAYEHIRKTSLKDNQRDGPYHYGAHLVEKIINTPNQELGSHTFSHYYCLDGNLNDETIFAADCEAFKKISLRFNQPITSIVFPRNQTTKEALVVCKQNGLTTYRGTPSHFLYTGKREKDQTNLLLRALRLIDTYINLSGHHTYKFSTIYRTNDALMNVQGSWFLRPYSKTLHIFERLKIRRIKNAMAYAAKHNEIFHLWWHPHNFGINRKENIQNLLEIIDHFKTLEIQYGMQSANMQDIRDVCDAL